MDSKTFQKNYALNRHNTMSIKWERADKEKSLPMWIADIDFKLPEKVIKGMSDRMIKGDFGYSHIPNDYYEVMIKFNKEHQGTTFKKEWIRFSKGAIDGLYQLVYAFTKEKDGIMINTPVYHPFAACVKKTKRKLVESKLIRKDADFSFDFEDIENKIIKNKVKMFILCSPHNPIGRVWTKKELTKLFEICKKHNCLVVADEVHGDLIMPDVKFTEALSLTKYRDNVIALNAVSKTFSLAIFSHCHIIIPNEKLRNKFIEYQDTQHRSSVNAICCYASYLAYQYGSDWLDGLNKTIFENYLYMSTRLAHLGIKCCHLEGTYLLYVDFGKYTEGKTAKEFLSEKCHILVNAGEQFAKGYEKWARINLGTTHKNVKLACDSIEKAIKK